MKIANRPLVLALASLSGYLGWLSFNRWLLLISSDIAIIVFIAALSAFLLFLLFLAMDRLAVIRRIYASNWRWFAIPVVGAFAWFIFFALVTDAVADTSVFFSFEHIVNNGAQFIWSGTKFVPFVALSLLLGEIIFYRVALTQSRRAA